MTALMQLSGHATVGVDVDPDRVADLVRQFGLDLHRCDVERSALPFADDSFACVLLCETFEHLRIDPAFVLSEINRVLAPGAPLLLTTPNVYSLPSLGDSCWAVALPTLFKSTASCATLGIWAMCANTLRVRLRVS